METEIKELIENRMEQLSKKNRHYVINMGNIEDPSWIEGKGINVYHKPGTEQWCTNCARTKELKRLLKEIKCENIQKKKHLN